jgi:hypothetical protein
MGFDLVNSLEGSHLGFDLIELALHLLVLLSQGVLHCV